MGMWLFLVALITAKVSESSRSMEKIYEPVDNQGQGCIRKRGNQTFDGSNLSKFLD